MKNSKTLEKIERENNFSGPAEWLEPSCLLARGVDRAVLYEANRLARLVISFLRDPSSGAARQLSGIGTWDAPIDAPTDATGQAEVLVGRWLRQIGVLDEVAETVLRYYRTPCVYLIQALEEEWRDEDATPHERAITRRLRRACEQGDVHTALEIVGSYRRNAAVDGQAEFVIAWSQGREEDFYPAALRPDVWNGRG